jgi:hypothetical protein
MIEGICWYRPLLPRLGAGSTLTATVVARQTMVYIALDH